MPETYSLKNNAARAARKAIADGRAPAPTYEIKGAAGGFRIAWDVTEARGPTEAEAAAVTKAIGHAPENAPKPTKPKAPANEEAIWRSEEVLPTAINQAIPRTRAGALAKLRVIAWREDLDHEPELAEVIALLEREAQS